MSPTAKSHHCIHLFLAELISQNSKDLNVPKRQFDLFLLTAPSTVQQCSPNLPQKVFHKHKLTLWPRLKRSHLNVFDLKPENLQNILLHQLQYFATHTYTYKGWGSLSKLVSPERLEWRVKRGQMDRDTTHKDTDTHTDKFRFLQAKERGIGSFAPIH